jgi:hypothetical protein
MLGIYVKDKKVTDEMYLRKKGFQVLIEFE